MNVVSKAIIAVVSVLSFSMAQAEVLDQWTTKDAANFHVYQNNSDGSILVNVSQEGAGLNQVTRLSLIMRLPTGGYYSNGTPEFKLERWMGVIPSEYVAINGVANASMTLNTCDVTAYFSTANACGEIDLTVTKDPLAFGDVGGGAYAYHYNGFVYQYAGAWSSHSSTAVGSVNGINIDTAANSAFGAARANIFKSTNSSVMIITGN